jgi:hypothetical protein
MAQQPGNRKGAIARPLSGEEYREEAFPLRRLPGSGTQASRLARVGIDRRFIRDSSA